VGGWKDVITAQASTLKEGGRLISMEILMTLMLMVAIGALIGGFTNSLAIKMLFRPYKEVYIGKLKVPFTPGLIPKRRDELANQMGRMVVEHLLTPEGLQRKLTHRAFKDELVKWAQNETKVFLSSEKSINVFISEWLKEDSDTVIKGKLEQYLEERYDCLLASVRQQTVLEAIPGEWLERLDQKIPNLSHYIVSKAIAFFESEEGKRRLRVMIDDFLATRGTLGNMVQMFLGNESLVNKVQPEVIKFLRNEGTANLLEELLKQEWGKVKKWELGRIEDLFGRDRLKEVVVGKLLRQIPVDRWLHAPIRDLVAPYQNKINDQIVPHVVDHVVHFISARINVMMEKFHLSEVVKEQVESFSVDRLEEMVLSISKREFKMITYLGALLGGGIGLIQGLLVLFIQNT
jgi:uncharacterized membrane protein YheB (UPF0754 family)